MNEEIRTKQGQLVVSAGQIATDPLLRIIKHCIKNGALANDQIISVKNFEEDK